MIDGSGNHGSTGVTAGEPIQERMSFGAEVRLLPRHEAARPDPEITRRLARELTLERPFTFLDFEATGIDVTQDRIVEVALIRLEPDGSTDVLDTLVNPGVAIPPESTAVHHITDDDVSEAPTLAEIAARMLRLLRGADLAGYNLGRYDLPLLDAELARQGLQRPAPLSVVDICVIFKRMERRDLGSAHRFYCGAEPPAPHTASGDTVATMDVLAGQLKRYPELPRGVAGLAEFTAPRR